MRVKNSVRREMNPGEQFTGTLSYVAMLGNDNDTISTFTASDKGNVTSSNITNSGNIGTFTVTADDAPGSTGCITFTMTSSSTPATISKIDLHIKIRDKCYG